MLRVKSFLAHIYPYLWFANLLAITQFSRARIWPDLSLFLLLPAMHLAVFVFLLPSVMHLAAPSTTVSCFKSQLHSPLAGLEQPIMVQKVQKYGNK